jgi:Wiskott-Aldrich syndrome protein
LYGGGPCTTILHSNLRPTLPIFSEIVGLGRFENSKCHVPWATTGQSPPALQYSALMDGKRPKHVISPVRELDPDPGHPEIYISLPPQPSTQGDAYIYTTMPRAPSARTPANWPTGPVLSRLPASPVARAPARRLLALDSPVSSPAVPPPPPTRQLASALPPATRAPPSPTERRRPGPPTGTETPPPVAAAPGPHERGPAHGGCTARAPGETEGSRPRGVTLPRAPATNIPRAVPGISPQCTAPARQRATRQRATSM